MINLSEKMHPFIEMSNIRQKYTGLPMIIWIKPKMGTEKHNARIKVQKNYSDKVSSDMFSITIDKFTPQVIGDTGKVLKQKDIDKVIQFVKDNFHTLIDVWNDNIDPIEATLKFKKKKG